MGSPMCSLSCCPFRPSMANPALVHQQQQRPVARDTLRLSPLRPDEAGPVKYKYTVETLLAYGALLKQRQDVCRSGAY